MTPTPDTSKVLEQARDALQKIAERAHSGRHEEDFESIENRARSAITALESILSRPEAAGVEPVVWLVEWEFLAATLRQGPSLKLTQETWSRAQDVVWSEVRAREYEPEQTPYRNKRYRPLYISLIQPTKKGA